MADPFSRSLRIDTTESGLDDGAARGCAGLVRDAVTALTPEKRALFEMLGCNIQVQESIYDLYDDPLGKAQYFQGRLMLKTSACRKPELLRKVIEEEVTHYLDDFLRFSSGKEYQMLERCEQDYFHPFAVMGMMLEREASARVCQFRKPLPWSPRMRDNTIDVHEWLADLDHAEQAFARVRSPREAAFFAEEAGRAYARIFEDEKHPLHVHAEAMRLGLEQAGYETPEQAAEVFFQEVTRGVSPQEFMELAFPASGEGLAMYRRAVAAAAENIHAQTGELLKLMHAELEEKGDVLTVRSLRIAELEELVELARAEGYYDLAPRLEATLNIYDAIMAPGPCMEDGKKHALRINAARAIPELRINGKQLNDLAIKADKFEIAQWLAYHNEPGGPSPS